MQADKIDFDKEDICQIMIGAFALAMPIAFTQEAWQLAENLPLLNLCLLLVLSLFFLAIYTRYSVFGGNIKGRKLSVVCRVIIAYLISLAVVAILLFAINKFPVFSEPILALKRLVLIGMPASLGGIIVDSLDKE
jgi:uncharacterized membrane protein